MLNRLAFAIFALIGTATATAAIADPWITRQGGVPYRIAEEAYGLGQSVDSLVLVFLAKDSKGAEFWAAERRDHRNALGRPMQHRHQWIDGRACPALQSGLAELARLPPIQFGEPGHTDEGIAVLDGGAVTVVGPAPAPPSGSSQFGPGVTMGRMIRVTEHAGPLVSWWFKASPKFERCWRDSPQLNDKVVLPTRLGTDEAANKERP